MHARQTALIIGAGMGGIAAAAHLARSGHEVTVLEKNSTPGGRCSQLSRDGHRFDIGATLLLMPELYAETYAALGERMEDHLDLRRVDRRAGSILTTALSSPSPLISTRCSRN